MSSLPVEKLLKIVRVSVRPQARHCDAHLGRLAATFAQIYHPLKETALPGSTALAHIDRHGDLYIGYRRLAQSCTFKVVRHGVLLPTGLKAPQRARDGKELEFFAASSAATSL